MSLWFYAYFHVSYLFLILGSIVFNFCVSRLLLGFQEKKWRKFLLSIGILANLGVIFYFKYFNFFLSNISLVTGRAIAVRTILLPLGISFFTFQQISYLVDSYRKETEGYRFLEYALFISFFPQLVAGPIVLHGELIPQFRDPKRKRFDHDMFAQGIRLFSIGLFKKVMIADVLGKGVDWGFGNTAAMTGPDAVVVSLLYMLQIYFDFSGYSNMACGLANMFHLELPVNFLSPYKATSILEFWQRWHLTLTRFLRKYIYFPMGGSKKGIVRTVINVMVVFLVSGIWHGAAWTFILWGLIHGAASALCRLFRSAWEKVPRILGWLCTFVFVDLSWILFRAETLPQAGAFFAKLFAPWDFRFSGELLRQFDLLEFTYVEEHVGILGRLASQYSGLHLAICLAAALLLVLLPKNCQEKKFVPGVGNALGSVVLLVWSVLSFSGLSTFLYFNF